MPNFCITDILIISGKTGILCRSELTLVASHCNTRFIFIYIAVLKYYMSNLNVVGLQCAVHGVGQGYITCVASFAFLRPCVAWLNPSSTNSLWIWDLSELHFVISVAVYSLSLSVGTVLTSISAMFSAEYFSGYDAFQLPFVTRWRTSKWPMGLHEISRCTVWYDRDRKAQLYRPFYSLHSSLMFNIYILGSRWGRWGVYMLPSQFAALSMIDNSPWLFGLSGLEQWAGSDGIYEADNFYWKRYCIWHHFSSSQFENLNYYTFCTNTTHIHTLNCKQRSKPNWMLTLYV